MKIELTDNNLRLDVLNRCQRNWIAESVSDEDRSKLEVVANATPTKQNVNYFRVLSISNTEIQNELFYLAHSESDQKDLKNNNTQMLAPLLFCWIGNVDETWDRVSKKQLSEYHLFAENLMLNAGISAGAVLTTANLLNYETGFCKCFDPVEVQKYFKSIGILEENDTTSVPILFLGIGKADHSLLSNTCETDQDTYNVRRNELARKPVTRL